MNATLLAVASAHSLDMWTRNFFAHDNPDGDDPFDRITGAGYTYSKAGENLAAGPQTSAEVMKAWMDSPPHRDVILDPSWREIGIAVRSGGEYSIYWVQEFGDPAGS